MMSKILTIGSAGVGAIEVVDQVPVPDLGGKGEIIKLVLQVVIALASLIKLKRTKRATNN